MYSPMNKRSVLYLDMDGVITDFCGAFLDLFGDKYGIDVMEIPKTSTGIWKEIEKEGINFWKNINWMPEGKNLYKDLKGSFNKIIFLSALPSRDYPIKRVDKIAEVGKRIWLYENIGFKESLEAIICLRSEKKNYSGFNKILLDDSLINIIEWEEYGGTGYYYI